MPQQFEVSCAPSGSICARDVRDMVDGHREFEQWQAAPCAEWKTHAERNAGTAATLGWITRGFGNDEAPG
jgi:hypothetical protein